MSSSTLPAQQTAQTPAVAPSIPAPIQTGMPSQALPASNHPSGEGTIKLNGREYTLAEAASLLDTAQKIITSAPAESKTPAQVDPVRTPSQASPTIKNPLEAPTHPPTKIQFDDLSDEGKFLYGQNYKLVDDIISLASVVQTIVGELEEVTAQVREHETVNALRIAGIDKADIAFVRALRAQGITDPLKAIPTILAMAGAKPSSDQGTQTPPPESATSPGPEGAGGGASTSFVFDPKTMSANEAMARIQRGETPVAAEA